MWEKLQGKNKVNSLTPTSCSVQTGEQKRPPIKESNSIGGIDENLANSNLVVSEKNGPKFSVCLSQIYSYLHYPLLSFEQSPWSMWKRAVISTFRNVSRDREEAKRKQTPAGWLGNVILQHRNGFFSTRQSWTLDPGEWRWWWRLLSHADLCSCSQVHHTHF